MATNIWQAVYGGGVRAAAPARFRTHGRDVGDGHLDRCRRRPCSQLGLAEGRGLGRCHPGDLYSSLALTRLAALGIARHRALGQPGHGCRRAASSPASPASPRCRSCPTCSRSTSTRHDLVQALGIMFIFLDRGAQLRRSSRSGRLQRDQRYRRRSPPSRRPSTGVWLGQKARHAVSAETFRRDLPGRPVRASACTWRVACCRSRPMPLPPFKVTICGIPELPQHCSVGVSHVLSIIDTHEPRPSALDHLFRRSTTS